MNPDSLLSNPGNLTDLTDLSARLRVQHRLIAVWALAEGFLGGILHGLHLPVTGLVVGSVSVCCLALLSRVNPKRGELLKATLLVLLVKAMFSPHSPPMAYFAVFSQGFLAELLFSASRRYKLNCFLLAILTQLQSAIQHLIVVLVVMGLDFWQALEQYINKLTATLGLTGRPYALYLACGYVLVHVLTGIYIGWVAGNLPTWLKRQAAIQKTETQPDLKEEKNFTFIKPEKPGKKRRFSLSFLLIWVLLAAVFLQSYVGIGPAILPKAKAVQIIIRAVLIVSVWYFVISPFLLQWFRNWLRRQQGPLQTRLQTVLDLLPETQFLLKQSWHKSKRLKGLSRLRYFLADAGARLFATPE